MDVNPPISIGVELLEEVSQPCFLLAGGFVGVSREGRPVGTPFTHHFDHTAF